MVMLMEHLHIPRSSPCHALNVSICCLMQGQEVSTELHKHLTSLQQQLSAQVLHVAGLPAELVRPYGTTMERCTAADKAKAVDNCQEEIKQRTSGKVPQVRHLVP